MQNSLAQVLGRPVMRAHRRQTTRSEGSSNSPRIGIVNTAGGLAACYSHLDEIAKLVADAAAEASGMPIEVRTSAPCDGLFFVLGGRSEVPAAWDLLARDVEAAARGARLDGLVFLASCDSTTPGHLAAAARLDLPSIVVPCGFQASGQHAGRRVSIGDLYEAVGAVEVGRLPAHELDSLADVAIASPGVCAGLGTANTMHVVAEALGMSLPGTTPIWAGSSRLRGIAADAGRKIVELVKRGPSPRTVLTESALRNAARVVLAVGGAATSVLHLGNLARELGYDLDMHEVFDAAGGRIRQTFRVAPAGSESMESFEQIGGTLGAMRLIRSELDLGATTIAGQLGDVLDQVAEQHAGPDAGTALGEELPGLIVIRGSLAPLGAMVRPGTTSMRKFRGPAIVLKGPEEALGALRHGHLSPGSAIILREGIDDFACLAAGAGLTETCALLTPGGFSGLSRGLVVGFMRSGGAPDHPMAGVTDGDEIIIDLDARRLDVVSAQDQGGDHASAI